MAAQAWLCTHRTARPGMIDPIFRGRQIAVIAHLHCGASFFCCAGKFVLKAAISAGAAPAGPPMRIDGSPLCEGQLAGVDDPAGLPQ